MGLDHSFVIPAKKGVGFELKRNQILEVCTPNGSQVSDFFCVSQDLNEYFSSLRTLDFADTIFITRGHRLYSQNCEVLATVLQDTCGVHDVLMPPCSLKMYQIEENDDRLIHPSCQENLVQALEPFGVDKKMLHCSYNLFMNVPVALNGEFKITNPLAKAGDRIQIKAEKDLFVGLTACPHKRTNGQESTEIQYRILV